MNDNVLILSCGRRVELVKSFLAAQKKLNSHGKIFAADCSSLAPALYFANDFCLLPKVSDKNYINHLIALCNQKNIAIVVPTIDTELPILAKNKELLEKNTRAKILISDLESIDICFDKGKTAEFFRKNNIKAPKTYFIEGEIPEDIIFPLFIKPRNGSSSINTFKVRNERELNFFMDYVPEPLVQEFISGTEYTIDVFCDFNGKIISIVPRIRLATRSGEILRGKIAKNKSIIESVINVITRLNVIGHITLQGFLTNKDDFYYIEINPRFGGGAPMSFMAGANSPEFLLRLMNGETLYYNDDYSDGEIYCRFDDCIKIPVQE